MPAPTSQLPKAWHRSTSAVMPIFPAVSSMLVLSPGSHALSVSCRPNAQPLLLASFAWVRSSLVRVEVAGFGEGGSQEARGYGDDAEAGHQDEEGEDLAADRDRVDVTVADRGQGSDRPPEAVEDRREHLGQGATYHNVTLRSAKS